MPGVLICGPGEAGGHGVKRNRNLTIIRRRFWCGYESHKIESHYCGQNHIRVPGSLAAFWGCAVVVIGLATAAVSFWRAVLPLKPYAG